jgi:hypothetical protein
LVIFSGHSILGSRLPEYYPTSDSTQFRRKPSVGGKRGLVAVRSGVSGLGGVGHGFMQQAARLTQRATAGLALQAQCQLHVFQEHEVAEVAIARSPGNLLRLRPHRSGYRGSCRHENRIVRPSGDFPPASSARPTTRSRHPLCGTNVSLSGSSVTTRHRRPVQIRFRFLEIRHRSMPFVRPPLLCHK